MYIIGFLVMITSAFAFTYGENPYGYSLYGGLENSTESEEEQSEDVVQFVGGALVVDPPETEFTVSSKWAQFGNYLVNNKLETILGLLLLVFIIKIFRKESNNKK